LAPYVVDAANALGVRRSGDSRAFLNAIGGVAAPAAYAHGFQINALLVFICIGLSVLPVRH
jgi:hypothetical protein